MFIAVYNGSAGIGHTLEEAFSNLVDIDYEADDEREDVDFYEATKLEVEFKIVKKEVVKVIKSTNKP